MRLVCVSNRLPVVIARDSGGRWRGRSGAGGLVTALGAALRRRGGLWMGWAGVDVDGEEDIDLDGVLREHARDAGYQLASVPLTAEDREGFYQGFSNEIIWPLFHDMQERCNFEPGYWRSYVQVNDKFAEAVRRQVRPDDQVWIHDYHLMLVADRLRRRGVTSRLGFFLHIPFPPPDIFSKLPWRVEVLRGLLQFDVVGLQTPRDVENFTQCVRVLCPEANVRRRRGETQVTLDDRTALVAAFPISIDFAEFADHAASELVTAKVRRLTRQLPDRHVLLSVDRLDYTKGILYRLKSFAHALDRFPELHQNVTLVQVVVPSREGVEQYQELRRDIDQLVGSVNGRFTQPGWVPIHHIFRGLERDELLAFYRVADVGLVTPFKDGMNLVAKEYCACQVNSDGVLILSEFAGAAAELGREALLVNPYDIEGVAQAIRTAISMDRRDRRRRMRRLRDRLRRNDVHRWVESFLGAMGGGAPRARGPIAVRSAPSESVSPVTPRPGLSPVSPNPIKLSG